MKSIYLIVILFLPICVFAQEKVPPVEEMSPDEQVFTINGGVKFITNKDEDSSSYYYKPYAGFGFMFSYADINFNYYRWQSYTVPDVSGNEKKINLNEPELKVSLYAGDIVTIDGGGRYKFGDVSYKELGFNGAVDFTFSSFSFGGGYSRVTGNYSFNGDNKTIEDTIECDVSKDILETLSIDLSYEWNKVTYDSYGFDLKTNSVRLGLFGWPKDWFSWFTGAGFGYDSDETMSPCFDAGLIFKVKGMVKLTASYSFNCDISDSTTSTGTTGTGKNGGGSSTSYDTSLSHTVVVSASLYY